MRAGVYARPQGRFEGPSDRNSRRADAGLRVADDAAIARASLERRAEPVHGAARGVRAMRRISRAVVGRRRPVLSAAGARAWLLPLRRRSSPAQDVASALSDRAQARTAVRFVRRAGARALR